MKHKFWMTESILVFSVIACHPRTFSESKTYDTNGDTPTRSSDVVYFLKAPADRNNEGTPCYVNPTEEKTKELVQQGYKNSAGEPDRVLYPVKSSIDKVAECSINAPQWVEDMLVNEDRTHRMAARNDAPAIPATFFMKCASGYLFVSSKTESNTYTVGDSSYNDLEKLVNELQCDPNCLYEKVGTMNWTVCGGTLDGVSMHAQYEKCSHPWIYEGYQVGVHATEDEVVAAFKAKRCP